MSENTISQQLQLLWYDLKKEMRDIDMLQTLAGSSLLHEMPEETLQLINKSLYKSYRNISNSYAKFNELFEELAPEQDKEPEKEPEKEPKKVEDTIKKEDKDTETEGIDDKQKEIENQFNEDDDENNEDDNDDDDQEKKKPEVKKSLRDQLKDKINDL